MTNSIVDRTIDLWKTGRRVKTAASGWLSADAPCCVHNGESADTRGRGGLIQNGDSVSYHCFNCGFKTSYVPGRPLSYKFRKLLGWFGADDNQVRQLVIEAIRIKEQLEILQPQELPPPEPVSYKVRPLPNEAISFKEFATFSELNNNDFEMPKQFHDAVNYAHDRRIDLHRYDFYWTPELEHKLNYRLIVPFEWQGQIIGYTARATVDGIKPKYHTEHEPNFVFNINKQRPENKFVLVTEGPFDAMSIDGVAILGNECSEVQADIIDSLGKEVIVVPDFDVHINTKGRKVWPGSMLIDQAVEYGWSVSFPVWRENCKDVNDAVVKYGRLFVLKTILDSAEHNRLKIEILKRKIYNA